MVAANAASAASVNSVCSVTGTGTATATGAAVVGFTEPETVAAWAELFPMVTGVMPGPGSVLTVVAEASGAVLAEALVAVAAATASAAAAMASGFGERSGVCAAVGVSAGAIVTGITTATGSGIVRAGMLSCATLAASVADASSLDGSLADLSLDVVSPA